MATILQSTFAPIRVPDNLWNRVKTYFETEEAQDRIPAPIPVQMVALRILMQNFFRFKTTSGYLLLKKNIETFPPYDLLCYIQGNYYLNLFSVLFDCFECMPQKLASFNIRILPSIPPDLEDFTMTSLSKEKRISYVTYSNPVLELWRQGQAPGVQHNPHHGEWIVYVQETPSCSQDHGNISTQYKSALNNLPADIIRHICGFRIQKSERHPLAQDVPSLLIGFNGNYVYQLQQLTSLLLAHECVQRISFTAGKLSSTCRRYHRILAPELQRAKQLTRLVKCIFSGRPYLPLHYITVYQCLARGFYWETIRFYLHIDPSVLMPNDDNPIPISDFLVIDRNLVKFLLKICKKHEIEWFQSRLYQQIQEGMNSNDGQKLQRALDLQESLGEKEMNYLATRDLVAQNSSVIAVGGVTLIATATFFAIRLLRRLS